MRASVGNRTRPRLRTLLAVALTLSAAVAVRWTIAATTPAIPEAVERFEATYGIDLPDWYGESAFFGIWAKGDGQGFVAIAADPLLRGPATELAVLDIRYSRVGYSLAGLALALGQADWIPIGLFGANVLALGGFAWLVATRAERFGPRQWWLLVNPALFIAFASDTAEAFGLVLALGAMTASIRQRSGTFGAALGTVRPEMVALTAAGRRPVPALVGGALAIVAVRGFVALQGSGTASDTMNVAPPGFGYLEALPRLTRPGALVVGAVFVASVVTVYLGLTREHGLRRLGWVGYGLLVLMLSEAVISSAPNLLRVAGGLPLLWLAGRGWTPASRASSPD